MTTQLVTIPFNNQSLIATLVNKVPHVALKPICESLGIDWDSQMKRIKRHPVLNSTTVMITAVAQDGKLREMLMMPIKYLNGWLFGIDSSRVKSEAKELVISYQRECFEVLANHFMPKAAASPFITEKEARLLQKAIISVAAGSQSKSLYTKLYDGYGITTYHHVPAGKLNEAMVFLGLQPPEMPQYVLIDARELESLKSLPAPTMQKVEPIAAGCVVISIEKYDAFKKLDDIVASIRFALKY